MEIFKTALAAIFVFGVIIIIHELGHFVTAKLNKIYVYRFAIGFGPKIFKYQGKETLYTIGLLPLGGLVDLREDESDLTNERSFGLKKPYQRLMVILAGAFMNFILAYVLIVSVFLTEPLPTTTVGNLAEDMPAIEAGIEVGDRFISINNNAIKTWNDVTKYVAYSDETSFTVVIERDGQEQVYNLVGKESDGFIKIGVGTKFEKNPSLAFSYAFKDFKDKSTLILDGFVKLVTGKIGADQVSGPIGIIKQVNIVTQTNNFKNLLYFTAILSINLGIFNLMPIPALDGSRALFIIYEMIFKKPINKEKEAYVHFGGFVLLMLLMIVLVFKDLAA